MSPYLINYISVALLILVILSQWIAFKIGKKALGQERKTKLGAVEAAIFGLLGFLIALTFAGAYVRYEARSQMVIKEANSISTAFLRLDLLPQESKVLLQKKFVEYIDARILLYDLMNDLDASWAQFRHLENIQMEIWDLAVMETATLKDTSLKMLLFPAMNEMFDVLHSHLAMILTHTSKWIFCLFIFMLFICSILSGMTMVNNGRFSLLYATVFSLVTVATLYMIFDLEYPRYGLIHLQFVQDFINDLKPMMLEHMKHS